MISFPNAKINLGLHITSKRKDGYHEIETCLVPIPIYDALEMILETKKVTWNTSGIPIPGDKLDNLILKAYRIIKKDFPDIPPLSIHLHKSIPMGAGLGGGSADGAFAIKMMNSLFELHLDDFFLEEYAEKLGSDCPFFIENTPKIARGRGELLESISLNLRDNFLVLINPNIHIGTKEAYAGVIPTPSKVNLATLLQEKERWKNELVNDFEPSIFKNHPILKTIKESFYQAGAYYAAMSGSGSSMFGLFDQKPVGMAWDQNFFVREVVL